LRPSSSFRVARGARGNPHATTRGARQGCALTPRGEIRKARSKSLKIAGLFLLAIAGFVVYRLLGMFIAPKVEERVARIGLTPNQVAANGPLPGEVSLYAKELACQQKILTPGYYCSLNGARSSVRLHTVDASKGRMSKLRACRGFRRLLGRSKRTTAHPTPSLAAKGHTHSDEGAVG